MQKTVVMEQSKETIIQKSYDLLKFGIILVGQFPQKHKFTLGDRMQGHLSDVLEIVVEAYYAPAAKKRPMLERINVLLEMNRHYCRLGFDLGLYNSLKYEDMARRLNELGRMNGGWIKTLPS